MMYLAIAAGLALLAIGGEILLRAAISLARHARLPDFVIGVVLLGFGTSAPELATSVDASLKGLPGIAIGNVVGSNIANILLILGTAALAITILCSRAVLARDGTVLMATAVIAVLISLLGELGRLAAAVLVLLLLIYMTRLIREGRRQETAMGAIGGDGGTVLQAGTMHPGIAVPLAVAGLAVLIFGADMLVSGATALARTLGVSESLIGLTIVAVGTSLPELAVSISACLKRQGDVVLGNIVGSNIFNTLGILGAAGLAAAPLAVPEVIASLDVWVMLGATGLLLAFAWTGHRIGRREGGAMVLLYAAYVVGRTMLDGGGV